MGIIINYQDLFQKAKTLLQDVGLKKTSFISYLKSVARCQIQSKVSAKTVQDLYGFIHRLAIILFGEAAKGLSGQRALWCFPVARFNATPAALPHGSCEKAAETSLAITQDLTQPIETVLLIECNACQLKRDVSIEKFTVKGDVMICTSCQRPTMHRLIEIEERRKQDLPIDFPDRRKSRTFSKCSSREGICAR